MNPCLSPSPCTVRGSPTTEERTPRSARARVARALRDRPAMGPRGTISSHSVATRPGTTAVPDAMTRGLPEPSSAAPIVSMAPASTAIESWIWAKSWMKARWMTPSLQVAAAHLGARGGEGGGRGIRPGKPENLVTRADELGYDGRTDPTGRVGDE